jgi:hypothetical protein
MAVSDIEAAWRLAFVVVADRDLATKAVGRALAELGSGDNAVQPVRTDLFATTLRLSLSRAAESPDMKADSAVTTALWQLPPEQRAALWLARVTELDDATLGTVLGVSALSAGHVADRAAEWLDVALDHESGPLCQHETKLADFIDGRLPLVEAAEIDDHLAGCPTCRTKVRAFEALADLKTVLSRAVPEPPANLASEAVRQQEAGPPARGGARQDDSPRPAPVRRERQHGRQPAPDPGAPPVGRVLRRAPGARPARCQAGQARPALHQRPRLIGRRWCGERRGRDQRDDDSRGPILGIRSADSGGDEYEHPGGDVPDRPSGQEALAPDHGAARGVLDDPAPGLQLFPD